jgi:hypothetical protein
MRSLPDAPETLYLVDLMASHEFQTALQNYLDLEDLRKRLVGWQSSLDAFEGLVEARRGYYEPLLPEVDSRFRELDSRIRVRLAQRAQLEQRLERLLVSPRPELLVTSDEYDGLRRIERLEQDLQGRSGAEVGALRTRLRRLRGVITWQQEVQYHERLTEAHAHLAELQGDVEALSARYDAFVRTRQAASHGYEGHAQRIAGLRVRVGEALERLAALMGRQGHLLEVVAIEELGLRRDRLEIYRNQARFALADSYDRAAKAQALEH